MMHAVMRGGLERFNVTQLSTLTATSTTLLRQQAGITTSLILLCDCEQVNGHKILLYKSTGHLPYFQISIIFCPPYSFALKKNPITDWFHVQKWLGVDDIELLRPFPSAKKCCKAHLLILERNEWLEMTWFWH